jgi:preprotein translocase subunit SecE
VEEALPALRQAYATQGNEVVATEVATKKPGAVTRTRTFVGEVVEELKKVTWPDFPQLKNATLVIIVFVIIVALIIWVMDLSVRGILNVIMDLFAR